MVYVNILIKWIIRRNIIMEVIFVIRINQLLMIINTSGGGPAVIGHPCGSWVWGQLAVGSPPSATGPEHVWGMGQPSAV